MPASSFLRAPPPCAPTLLASALLLAFAAAGSSAHAQAGDEPLRLKPSARLASEQRPPSADQGPAFLRADRIDGRLDIEARAVGAAELRRFQLAIKANEIVYDVATDWASASGAVRVAREGNVFTGPAARLRTQTGEGRFEQPSYRFARYGASGSAEHVDFLDFKRARAQQATYSTCSAEQLDWQLTAREVLLDFDADEGSARDARLSFMGLTILAVPTLNFPLSNKRRSGFLPPLIGLSDRAGFEIAQPYYWDIAPNRDATLTTVLSTKRGLGLDGEFRYLETDYKGEARLFVQPRDQVADRSRWAYSSRHEGRWQPAALAGPLSYSWSVARVSDDAYWKDYPKSGLSEQSQRLLPADFSAAYYLPHGMLYLRSLKWQTLQDAASPISPPYDLRPQLLYRYQRYDRGGFDLALDADWSRFANPLFIGGQRALLLGSVAYPLQRPGWYLTPRLQLRAARYQTDRPMSDGRLSAGVATPTFSLDAGATFERPLRWLGQDLLQTLEPRALYVRSPFRDQQALPLFDTSAYELSFASLFSDNAFSGNDRTADAHTLTLGAASRFIDPQSGAERMKFQVAQRLRFSPQRVVVGGSAPIAEKISDLLVGATINLNERFAFDGTVQYNPDLRRSVRSVLAGRWTPERYKTLNMAYRFSRGNLEQIDTAWQWPLQQSQGRNWYTVGRVNYSLSERRMTDSIAGIEFESCCWLARVVAQRTSTSSRSASTKLFFQLELTGFGRLGSNPLATLRQNIPQYRVLREQPDPPAPYAHYE